MSPPATDLQRERLFVAPIRIVRDLEDPRALSAPSAGSATATAGSRAQTR
ncbi:hypothetical protein GCM10027294_42360 [Marinactinospora endophytica]